MPPGSIKTDKTDKKDNVSKMPPKQRPNNPIPSPSGS